MIPIRIPPLRARREDIPPLTAFLVDQFKVVMKNMNGEPVMPTDEEFDEADNP